MKGLQGKNVLVTGGAKGIGRAIVERFLQEGCKVWVADKDESALSSLDPNRVTLLLLDISRQQDVELACSSFPIDILVNNAGIAEGDDHEKILATNINGTRYVTEAVLQGMKERKHGNVTFVSSVHTALAFQGDAAYDASKHWIVGYMRARALELASAGVRLNAIAPGAIQQAGPNISAPTENIKSAGQKVPLKRFGFPEEVANTVAFLASDEASYITGAEIRVDGGLSIKNPFRE